MITYKKTFCILRLVVEMFGHLTLNEQTNQNLIKVSRKRYYKTLGTNQTLETSNFNPLNALKSTLDHPSQTLETPSK